MDTALSLSLLNAAGVTYFFCVTLLSLVTAELLLLPTLANAGQLPDAARLLLYVACGQVLAHYAATVLTAKRNRAGGQQAASALIGQQPTNHEFCLRCRAKKPGGARHCPLCGCCVLLHDHHCFFTACCIGLHNRRHFLPLMLHVLLGTSLSSWLQYRYLALEFAPALSAKCWMYFYPITLALYASGHASGAVVATVTLLFATLFGALASAYFLGFQLLLVCRGQTAHEFSQPSRPRMSGSGCWRNCKRVFGSYGCLQFLCPLPHLPLPCAALRPAKTA